MILHHSGFPIRKSADQCLFTAPRSLSQLVTSFFGSWCQGIHLMLFIAWTLLLVLYKLLIFATLLEFRSIINFGLLTLLTCEKDQSFCIYLFELFHPNDPWIILANCSYPRFSWKTILLLDIRFETVFKHISFLKQFFSIICSFYSISCFIRFSMNICISEEKLYFFFFGKPPAFLVGSNGLEPSTSRLSGARSSHLSYEPM